MSEMSKSIMKKIENDEIKMRSKNFFRAKKAFLFILIMVLTLATIFILNLVFYFVIRNIDRGLEPLNLSILAGVFPYKWLFIGIGSIALFTWILRTNTAIYRKSLPLVSAIILVSFFASGYVLSKSNLNQSLEEKAGLNEIYDQYQYQEKENDSDDSKEGGIPEGNMNQNGAQNQESIQGGNGNSQNQDGANQEQNSDRNQIQNDGGDSGGQQQIQNQEMQNNDAGNQQSNGNQTTNTATEGQGYRGGN